MFDGRQIRQRLQNNHLKDAQRTMEEVEKVKKMIYEQNGNIMKRQKSEKKKKEKRFWSSKITIHCLKSSIEGL